MSIFDWVIGVIVTGAIILWLVGIVIELVPFLTVGAYRHLRYTRKGVCYKCKRRFAGFLVRPVDQMYANKALMPVCSCKDTTYLPMGDRHFAEW